MRDLFDPDLSFLARALAVCVISAAVCGAVGCHVVLRGTAFLGDAVAHAVFPGVAVAFVFSADLVLGGVVAGVATAVLIALVAQNRRLREDTVIGVLFVAAFAIGVVVVSQAPGYGGSLEELLVGSVTGVTGRDVAVVAGAAVVVLAVLGWLHPEFVAVGLDRETARTTGVRVLAIEVALYALIALAVVVSVRTVGTVLVLALLVTPAATARLLTSRLVPMMLLAPLIGAVGSLVGVWASWSWDLPTGATTVLVLTGLFLLAWLLAPRHGLLQTGPRARAVT